MSPRSRQGSTVSQGSRSPPSTCSWCSAASTARSPAAEVRVSAAVQAAASIPAGTGRPSATQSDFSVANRSRTSSPVLSTQLGAGTASRRIILPTVLPALLTGFTLAFARAVGEYGSVIFIAGNLPMRTEITPLLIVIRLEEFDYRGAAALGFVMLAISFVMLLVINRLQSIAGARLGHV